MAPGHRRTVTRSQLHADLYDELAGHRHAEHAREMAEALLRLEEDDYLLVGVEADFERAVVFDAAADTLVAREFGKHGVGDATEVARDVADPDEWVDDPTEPLGWVHPRYR